MMSLKVAAGLARARLRAKIKKAQLPTKPLPQTHVSTQMTGVLTTELNISSRLLLSRVFSGFISRSLNFKKRGDYLDIPQMDMILTRLINTIGRSSATGAEVGYHRGAELQTSTAVRLGTL
jgi:hypothetical protein